MVRAASLTPGAARNEWYSSVANWTNVRVQCRLQPLGQDRDLPRHKEGRDETQGLIVRVHVVALCRHVARCRRRSEHPTGSPSSSSSSSSSSPSGSDGSRSRSAASGSRARSWPRAGHGAARPGAGRRHRPCRARSSTPAAPRRWLERRRTSPPPPRSRSSAAWPSRPLGDPPRAPSDALAFAGVVFASFIVANFLNFVLMVADLSHALDGRPIAGRAYAPSSPVLPSSSPRAC